MWVLQLMWPFHYRSLLAVVCSTCIHTCLLHRQPLVYVPAFCNPYQGNVIRQWESRLHNAYLCGSPTWWPICRKGWPAGDPIMLQLHLNQQDGVKHTLDLNRACLFSRSCLFRNRIWSLNRLSQGSLVGCRNISVGSSIPQASVLSLAKWIFNSRYS
jgi:hypothetical protein